MAVGCKSIYRGLIPLFTRPHGEIHGELQIRRCTLGSTEAWNKQKLVSWSV